MEKVRAVLVSVPPPNSLLFFTGVFFLTSILLLFPIFEVFLLVLVVLIGFWAFELYSMYEYHFSKTRSSGGVVITGASRGIGKVIALHLQKLGYDVYAGVRNEVDGENLKKEATPEGGQLFPVILDVCDKESIAKAKKFVESKAGGAGIVSLINNAGVALAAGIPLEFTSEQDLKQSFEVNLFGTMNVTREFLPLLHQKPNSRVVFVSTVGTVFSSPLFPAYLSSKLALEGAVSVLRLELRHFGIHVALVRPGFTQTDMLQGLKQLSVPKLEAPPEQTPPALLPIYDEFIAKNRKKYDTLVGKTTVSPQVVADLVEHAVRAKQPRSEYNTLFDSPFFAIQLFPASLLAFVYNLF